MLKKLDLKILFKLYNFNINHRRLSEAVVFISKFSSVFFSTIYFAAVIYLIYNDKVLKEFILIPAVFYFLAKVIPYLYNRIRPFAKHNIKALVEQRKDHSFPSTHTGSSLIISLAFLDINPEIGIIMIFLAILTALSRIMTAVHYPSDILGTWLIVLILHFGFLNFLI